MVAVIIILILILGLLTYLALAPLILRIDTYQHQYYLQFGRLTRCWLEWEQEPIIKIGVPFHVFKIDPLKPRKNKSPEKKTKARAKHKKSTAFPGWKKIKRVLRSFKVRELFLEFDTDNVLWNAYLYPLFFLLDRQQTQFKLNYEGRNGLVLHIENRAARVLWAFLT